jgi:hypothetical protein
MLETCLLLCATICTGTHLCVFTDYGRMTTSRAVKGACSSKTHEVL